MNITEWIITSCVLLVLISAIRQIFKEKLPAKVRYGIWLIVLVRLLIPVSLAGSSISVLNLFSDERENMQAQNDGQVMSSSVNPYENSTDTQDWLTGAAGNQTSGENAFYPGSSNPDLQKPVTGNNADNLWKKVLAGVWIVGVAVCGLALLGSNLIFMRKLRRSRQLIPPRKINELQDCNSIAGRIPVYVSKLVNTPCLFGLFRPAIYIRPEDKCNRADLPYILKHEYTHYRHLDHIWAFCRSLCLMVHWYNPFVWAGAYWSRQDGELACDASVLAGMEDASRLEYGRLLIDLTKGNRPYGDMLCCATTMSGEKKNLRERVRRIAGRPRLFLIPTAIAISLCLAVVWVTFTGAAESNNNTDKESQGNESENGTEPEENEEWESAEKLINVMFADVTHDGVEDAVFTTIQFFSEEEETLSVEELLQSYSTATIVRVYNGKSFFNNYSADKEHWAQLALEGERTDNMQYPSNQEAIWERELANPHVGNGQLFLAWQNGEAYLLDSSAWAGQGMGDFSYQVFSLDAEGAIHEKDSGQISFATFRFSEEESWEEVFPVSDMIAYTEQIAPWIEDSTVVAVMDVGYDPLVSRPGQNYTMRPWEIWRGFGDAPTGMEDLEENLNQIFQELIAEDSSAEAADNSSEDKQAFTVWVSGGRELNVMLDTSRLRENYFAINQILVYEGEELLQVIDPSSVPPVDGYLWEGLFVNWGYTIGEPDIRDLNFDGSQDFGLLAISAYSRNVPYSYFLWNEIEEQFDYGFTMCSDLEIDTENRKLIEKIHETTGEYENIYTYTADGFLQRQ